MNNELFTEIIKPLRECLNLVFPPVMPLLIREAAKPRPDFEELARLISIDPGLTVTVLSLANSSYYSLNHKVTDLKRAIVVLGSAEILKLAISVTLKKSISRNMCKYKRSDFQNWSVILWGAIASEMIAQKAYPEQSDTIYLCALVKDLSLLLLCCSDNPKLKKYAGICTKDGQGIVVLGENQIKEEQEVWGIDHTRLTMELLTYWGFPKTDCEMLTDHHDLDNINSHDPAGQIIILATYWSEVEMNEKEISRLFRVRSIAKSVFGLDEDAFEQIRSEVSVRFKSMCLNLGISPDKNDAVYYDFPVARIQDLYFSAQELHNVQGDLQDVVRTIIKHLYWLWGLKDFRISLLSPLTNEFSTFYHDPKHGIMHESGGQGSAGNHPRSGIVFYLGDNGYIGLNQTVKEDAIAEIDLYTSFLSTSFDGYFSRAVNTTSKARLLDFIPQAVVRITVEGRVIQVNKQFMKIFNLSREPRDELFWPLARNLVQIDQDDSWNNFLNSDNEKYSKLFCPLESRMESPHAPCWHMTAHRVRLDGSVQILVMLEDITEISTLEKDIIRQGDYLRGIINSMQDIVFTVDRKGTILFASPAYKQDLLGKNFFHLAKPSSVFPTFWGPEILDKTNMPLEVYMIMGNSRKSMELAFNRLSGSTSPEYLIVGRDLTTIRRMEEKIKKQATFDHLTNIFNRYHFALFLDREAQRFLRKGSGLGLIFFDLDLFKDYNDRYGHQKGDEALQGFGRLLNSNSRKGMDYPCRYGGDEFVLLVTETDTDRMDNLVRRLLIAFEKEYGFDLSLSIGMAIMAQGESKESFLSRADKALFEAKKIRGNSFVWAAAD